MSFLTYFSMKYFHDIKSQWMCKFLEMILNGTSVLYIEKFYIIPTFYFEQKKKCIVFLKKDLNNFIGT